MSTPLYLANNFILKTLQESSREIISLSPMKLQKLIYFTYRDYMQTTDSPLFHEPICAWKYGPVVEVVYNHFKPFKASSIDRFYRDSDDGVHILNESHDPIGDLINSVWNRYRRYNGIELSNITHRPGSAWYIAWTNFKQFLDNEDIKNERVE